MKHDSATSELAESLLSSGWTIHLPATGWSMKPLLRPGCLLRIAPTRKVPRIGEIVLYRSKSGRLISHRVLVSKSEFILTKGDACVTPDSPVNRSRILGQVIAVEKPYFIPLVGSFALLAGRFLNQFYPQLVKLKTAIHRFAGAGARERHGTNT